MQRAFSRSILSLVVLFGFGLWGSLVSATLVYVPFLETVMSDGEPCFYAHRKEDVLHKEGKEFPLIRSVEITMGDTTVIQPAHANVELHGDLEECVKISQLFSPEIVQLIHPGIHYYIEFNTSYESDWKASIEQNRINAIKDSANFMPGKPMPPPSLPSLTPSSNFRGGFCVVKNEAGSIEMAKSDYSNCEPSPTP